MDKKRVYEAIQAAMLANETVGDYLNAALDAAVKGNEEDALWYFDRAREYDRANDLDALAKHAGAADGSVN